MAEVPGGRNMVVALASQAMGGPDQRLGLALMANFCRLLGERDLGRIRAVVLYNEAVKLVVAGCPVLPHLQSLEAREMPVILCRTCVEYFGLEDKLEAGRLGDMWEIQGLLLDHTVVRP